MFLIAFWSQKQSKIEESSLESMEKELESHLQEEPKLWSFIVLLQNQIMSARRENKERNLTWRIQEDSNYWTQIEHLWSPFYAYYMSFRSLWSQESNALNGVRIRVEMKKLLPLESNCTKLKTDFTAAKSQSASYEINLWLRNGDFQLAKFYSPCCMLRNPSECFQIFATDSFRFFLQIFVV